ncbi:uncharacterized protein RBU33_016128 [Hipposideros larvatus]
MALERECGNLCLTISKGPSEGAGRFLCSLGPAALGTAERPKRRSRCALGSGIKNWLAKEENVAGFGPFPGLPDPRPSLLVSRARGDPHCRVPPAGVSFLAPEPTVEPPNGGTEIRLDIQPIQNWPCVPLLKSGTMECPCWSTWPQDLNLAQSPPSTSILVKTEKLATRYSESQLSLT